MKLMLVMDSYWDMLPPEMHEMIMAYKRGQEQIDEERKERMRELCEEIRKYDVLKKKWGIGHIKYIISKTICLLCCTLHVKIVGYYLDEAKIPRERFLGYHYDLAWNRVDGIKSSLSYFSE